MDVAIKTCSECKFPKPVTDFHVRKKSPDGRHRLCKDCDSGQRTERYRSDPEAGKQSSQNWRGENKDRVLSTNREYKRRLRLEAIAHYSQGKNVCACCGEPEVKFLTIDHADGGGNDHRRAIGPGTHISLWLKKNDYPSGFQVLCFNCNCVRGIYGTCPHQEVLRIP